MNVVRLEPHGDVFTKEFYSGKLEVPEETTSNTRQTAGGAGRPCYLSMHAGAVFQLATAEQPDR